MAKFSHLSDSQVKTLIKQKVEIERRTTVEVIELLEEVERRFLHVQMAYGSLLEYCVKELKYSESAAYRRIAAMRLSKEIPEVKVGIAAGTLNLVSVTQAQVLFRDYAKSDEAYSKTEKLELLNSLVNTSKREAERIIAEERPEQPAQRDSIRAIPGGKFKLEAEIDSETMEKLETLKALLSNKHHNPTFNELLSMVADAAIKKLHPIKGFVWNSERKTQPPVVKPCSNSEMSKMTSVWRTS